MARLNLCIQYGLIKEPPQISRDAETGEPRGAIAYLHVIRGYRDAHDGKLYTRHDHPMVFSRDTAVAKEMATWKPNDVVLIKGTISTKVIKKSSTCVHCTDENGKPTKNESLGLMLYITPIFAQRIASFSSKEIAKEYVINSREISNIVELAGTLVKDPVMFKTKSGLIVSQYQIALNRKFKVREDNPEIRVDWPWIKSYGEQAIEDKLRLSVGSNIIVDGFLQTRRVVRKKRCPHCNKIYEWEDVSMEIVPYDTEYIWGTYLTDDDIVEQKKQDAEALRQELYNFIESNKDSLTEDYRSEDVDPASIKDATE